MKKRNEEKRRRIFSGQREEDFSKPSTSWKSSLLTKEKPQLRTQLTAAMLWRAYNRLLDSGMVSAYSGGTEPVRFTEKLVIVSVVITIVRIFTRQGVREYALCTFWFHCLCKTVKIFLSFLTHLNVP
jgi:hypothetical protein